MVDFFRPIQLAPVMPTEGVSPLVSQIIGVLGQGQALARQAAEDRRRRIREDFAQRLQEAALRRQAAANTPLDQAPVASVGDVAASQGIPDMNHDVASAAASGQVGQPRRSLPALKGIDGSVIPQAPLDYEEEAQQKQVADKQRALTASGEITMVTPEMSAQIEKSGHPNAALLKYLYPVGSPIPKSEMLQILKPDGLEKASYTDMYGNVVPGVFNKNATIGHNYTWMNGKGPNSDTSDPNLHGDDYLATLPPDRANEVKMIGNYDADVTKVTNPRGPARETLFKQVAQYNPNWSQPEYALRFNTKNSFRTGKDADVMKSINTVVHHLDKFSTAASNLDNWNIPAANAVKNWIKTQAGSSSKTNFDKDKTAVADELATVFKNTGATDQQVAAWKDTFSSSQSPSQLADGIDEALNLLDGRLKSQEFKYQQGIQSPLDKSQFQIYSPETQKILSALKERASQLRGLKTGAAAPASGAPATGVPAAGGTPDSGGLPQIKSKAEYDALPDHTPYFDVALGKPFCKNGCK